MMNSSPKVGLTTGLKAGLLALVCLTGAGYAHAPAYADGPRGLLKRFAHERQVPANAAAVVQRGRGNGAATAQTGAANSSAILQNGNVNTGVVTQAGTGNTAAIRQLGNKNDAAITQTGSGNNACIVQVGGHLGAEINQTGDNLSMGVFQTNKGARPIPAEVCDGAKKSTGAIRQIARAMVN